MLAIAQSLMADNPDDPRLIENLRQSWDDLGDVLADRDKLDEAAQAFGESLKLAQQLVAARPQDSAAQAVVADAWDDSRRPPPAARRPRRRDEGVRRRARRLPASSPGASRRTRSGRASWRAPSTASAPCTRRAARWPLARAAYDETLRIDREAPPSAPATPST